MAVSANDIIQNAFYLANILSNAANESPSTQQETDGLALLNQILDSLLKQTGFSGFNTFQTIENLITSEIYIGSSLVGVAPDDVTFVVTTPFMAIVGATVLTTSGNNQPFYPLVIYPYNAINRRYLVKVRSIPKYLYYSTFEDNTLGVYNKLFLDPSPDSGNSMTLNLTGVLQYDTVASGATNLRPNFSLYLQYALAFELSMNYGTSSQWTSQKEQRKDELYNLIVGSTPLDFTINTTVDAYSRRSR